MPNFLELRNRLRSIFILNFHDLMGGYLDKNGLFGNFFIAKKNTWA